MEEALLRFWSQPMTEELRGRRAQLWTSALSLLGEFFDNDFVLWDSKADNFGSSEGSLTDLLFLDVVAVEERSMLPLILSRRGSLFHGKTPHVAACAGSSLGERCLAKAPCVPVAIA